MTMTIPMWASLVAIRKTGSKVYHRRTGWNVFTGYRTLCGREIRGEVSELPLSRFSQAEIDLHWIESLNGEFKVCKTCLKRSNAL